MKRTFVLILLILLVGGGIYVGKFIAENTAWLNFDISELAIKENNLNPNTNASPDNGDELDKLAASAINIPPEYAIGAFAIARQLNLPEGFAISVYAAGLDAPRFFDFDSDNTLIVADKGSGKLIELPDQDADGVADEVRTIDNGLRNVHSVDWHDGVLYVAEESQIVMYSKNGGTAYDPKLPLIRDLPSDGGHSTRTVVVGPDNALYVSVGSSCNICEESDRRRAAVVRYNLDGGGEEIFAEGLRNSVGIVFHGDELWSVDNGRDRIGDNLPPEEVNILTKGKHYGWPYCYGRGEANPEFPERAEFCQTETAFPRYEMQAHSAPLGLGFLPETHAFPAAMNNDLFIAFHGSWNRTVPTGYKVVRIDTSQDSPGATNFISGWLENNGDAWGRPVGIGFDNNGVMYVSDDKAGAIYRVTYSSN
ncbi:MAG: PQQ-dependent sugar dehydrogenase [bacterium]|nr:PQQ-dependent sugar dehydrogenase [bacterium]